MADRAVADRYAQALFQVVPPQERQTILGQLQVVKQVLSDEEISRYLQHPKTPPEAKRRAFLSLGVQTIVEKFLLLLVEKNRDTFLFSIIEQFERLVNVDQKRTEAFVYSAVELDQPTLVRLQAKLEEMSGMKVELRPRIDESIWGGIKISMDGKVIDGSLSAVFNKFRRQLLAAD